MIGALSTPHLMSIKFFRDHRNGLDLVQQEQAQYSGAMPRPPDIVGNLISWLGFLPGAPLSRDQWMMLQRDNVPAKGAPGLEAFGIRPTPLASVGYEWLGRFHRGGKFAGRRINLTATN